MKCFVTTQADKLQSYCVKPKEAYEYSHIAGACRTSKIHLTLQATTTEVGRKRRSWSFKLRTEHSACLRTLATKRYEVAGGSRKLHNEELRNLYSSLNIINIIKQKRQNWEGHVSCV
jgi:hypothetical protein